MDTHDITQAGISIIIPCYNSAETIGETLKALSTQTGQIPYEIIVVNSSQDATAAIVRDGFPQVQLVQLVQQTLPGAARNKGAKHAHGKWIAFVDSDCTVSHDWLERMHTHGSDDFVAIGGPIENANGETSISHAGHLLEFSDFFTKKRAMIVDHIPAGNLMLLKSTFDQSGGFVEDFAYAQEDRLYSWKLRKKTGKSMLFHPDIKVAHRHRIRLQDFLRHQWRIGRGGAEILKWTDLRGSRIIKRRWLINVLVPGLAIKKMLLCLWRTCTWKPMILLKYPLLLPLLGCGMFVWMLGFATGVNQADMRKRSLMHEMR